MDDVSAQFFILVADAADKARIAGLVVELETGRDQHVRGVPAPQPAGTAGEQLDDTGWRDRLVVADTVVDLHSVTRFSIAQPSPGK